MEKSEKSDFAAKATNDADEKYNTRDFAAEVTSSADVKFCAHTLVASEKFCARDFVTLEKSKKSDFAAKAASGADKKYNASDFAAYDAGKNLALSIFRRKAGAENSAQTSKAGTSRRKT